MDNLDTDDGLAGLVIGLVRDADIIRKEYGHLEAARDVDGCCLVVLTHPSLLVELGAAKAELQWRFDVLVAPDGGEQFALFAMQARGAQVRLVMPLGDPSVQQYLSDSMQRGRFHVALLNEATQVPAFITIAGGFQPPGLMDQLLEESRSRPRNAQTLRWFGRFLSPLDGVRSLTPEHEVTHAVTALVSKDLEAELEAGPSAGRNRGTPLH